MTRTKKEENTPDIVEEKKTSTRGRKKKTETPVENTAVENDVNTSDTLACNNEALTQYQQDILDFDAPQQNAKLMKYTTADYETGSFGLELCTRHLKHLIKNTERSVLKIGVLLTEVDVMHGARIYDPINASYELKYCEFDRSNYDCSIMDSSIERHYFKDIYDYAAYTLGLSKGTVSNYINLVKRFTNCRISIHTGDVELLDAYKAYSPSQLIQLLPYADDVINQAITTNVIVPDMSCRMIARTMKDKYKAPAVLPAQPLITDDMQEALSVADDFEQSQQDSNKTVNSDADSDNWDASNIKITSLDALPDYSYFKSVFDMYINSGYEIELVAVRKG